MPSRNLAVFRARDFRVIDGVNEGEPLTEASDLAYEDVYALEESAGTVRLGLVTANTSGPFPISRDSDAGKPGARVYLDSLLTFIGPAGGARDALVFVEVDADHTIAEVYLFPLAPLARTQGYALITIDRDSAAARFASAARTAFARGPWSAAAALGACRFDAGRRAAAGF